ncbi:hypothetical protein MPH_08912 [Macrophomina phaseolina MS6]|uniref:Apple domain-containing protein n=1 Tax=Macrophomina phaseolina (strain MS6) TaxID=1126212 RepID=K2RH51_MACPH|nr:hypothetical protein MPH_08912 [Macrophomina phaseolina MS6]
MTASTVTASPTNFSSCPGTDRQRITIDNKQFIIHCSSDNNIDSYTDFSSDSINNCANLCALDSRCQAATYTNHCYLKAIYWLIYWRLSHGEYYDESIFKLFGLYIVIECYVFFTVSKHIRTNQYPNKHLRNIHWANTTPTSSADPSCPASDGQTFVSGGTTVRVRCNSDNPNVQSYDSQDATSISQCGMICASDPTCESATFTSRCYLKHTLGTIEDSAVGTVVLEIIRNRPSQSSTSSSQTSLSTETSSASSGSTISPSTSSSSSSATQSPTTPIIGSSSSSQSTETASSSFSSTGSVTSTSTATAAPACPASDNQLYTTNGVTFRILCNTDNDVTSYDNISANNLGDCADSCSADFRCLSATFTSRCYLKSSVGSSDSSASGTILLVRISSTSTLSRATSSGTSIISSGTTSPRGPVTTSGTISNGDGVTNSGTTSSSQSVTTPSTDSNSNFVTTSGSTLSLNSGTTSMRTSTTTSGGSFATTPGTMLSGTSTTTSGTVSISTSTMSSGNTPTSSTGSEATTGTSTTTTYSSSTINTPTFSPSALSCPGSDGYRYTTSSGHVFIVECYVDYSGGNIPVNPAGPNYASSLNECIQQCDSYVGCIDVSWNPGNPSGPCYLKNSFGTRLMNQNNVWGARLETTPSTTSSTSTPQPTYVPTCPDDDGSYFTTAGVTFQVECYTDHFGGVIGGPLQGVTFDGCMNACATYNPAPQPCIDVSWTPGQTCYLKYEVGDASYNEDIWGGKVVAAISSTVTPLSRTTTVSTISSPTSTMASSTTTRTGIGSSSASSLSSASNTGTGASMAGTSTGNGSSSTNNTSSMETGSTGTGTTSTLNRPDLFDEHRECYLNLNWEHNIWVGFDERLHSIDTIFNKHTIHLH